MSGVTGNFQGLAALEGALARLISPQARADTARSMGLAAMKQLSDEFRESRDPYGNKWAPLRLRRGRPLLDTGRLRASAALSPLPNGFAITMTAGYASTHQSGKRDIRPVRAKMLSWKMRGSTRRYFAKRVSIPRRQMLPEAATGGLGPYWSRALGDAALEQIRRIFQGSGP
jgi:phage gpG-like protein